VLIGIAALVIDGGSWFRTQRHLQTAADAAALAGAQDLPNTGTASATAVTYAQDNYNGVPTPTITFPSAPPCGPSACIDVAAHTTAPGIFARIYGSVFNNVNVTAHARAGVFVPGELKNVAPIAVRNTVACIALSCFGQTKTVTFDESNVSSSTIGLIDLTCHSTASTACGVNAGVGAQELKEWIVNGYPDELPANQWYGVKTGENIGPIKQGFTERAGTPLFFPVFDTVANSGPNYYFHIIGWSAFVVHTGPDDIVWTPSTKSLTGHFVTFIATDLAAGDPITGANDFGVHVIALIE
jgi:Putative Flp pilus-assembly TadE/G-like